ncbi:hypothetical protein BgiBS90_019348 [Biomphalaria glabrata]|uniref:Uncharacterized protein n=1 Tax=Biomphalaria glabrata TaxID=6526 RepID=A0A2C9M5I8_BIOGL|nr:hypothetical protein BgiBS90_019348 [Biomphalaria glabrata]
MSDSKSDSDFEEAESEIHSIEMNIVYPDGKLFKYSLYLENTVKQEKETMLNIRHIQNPDEYELVMIQPLRQTVLEDSITINDYATDLASSHETHLEIRRKGTQKTSEKQPGGLGNVGSCITLK